MKCIVRKCPNETSAVTNNNMNFSKKFCVNHSKSIMMECSDCKDDITVKPRYYGVNKEFICRKCSSIRNLKKTRTKEASKKRIETMKKNGSYDRWRKSSESREARTLGYQNMVKNGKVKNLIAASNTKEVLKRKQESRIKSGGFDRFMKAGHKKTQELWNNDPEYRKNMLENLKIGFNRDKFYSESLNIISRQYLDKTVSINDIDRYKGRSGVWAKYSIINGEKVFLDISQSANIGREMLFSIRALITGKANKNLTDDEINSKYKYNLHLYRKYRDMSKYSNIIFSIVAIDIDTQDEREAIEAQYAHDTKALFWNPAPGQMPIISGSAEIINKQ